MDENISMMSIQNDVCGVNRALHMSNVGVGGSPAASSTGSGSQQPDQLAIESDDCLLIKIHVPELNVQKCLQFNRDQLVWDVKQQCLASLPKELKESFNYGLFSPPMNGKAGKFLDEERRLGDYPFNGPVGYLELKYKRRVYKMISLDEKQLKSLHTRANLRRLLDYVANGQVEKITKMCSKGLDPNFHCSDTGETPLSLAAAAPESKKPAKTLIALVNGGALLDYRTRDGSTALHRAVERNSAEAVRTLLELGASPNYRDSRGLTPLYLTITHQADHRLSEMLLHDHATIGAQDLHGWHEVHHACKLGLRQHLEHLLFYGADMNARNASGNTPLHVCAVQGAEACARTLLFRGADVHALNYANQTAYQVAVIAGNLELADLIQNYRQEDVVPFREPPSYNPKRRSGIGWLPRSKSCMGMMLSSPCPSNRSSMIIQHEIRSGSGSSSTSGSVCSSSSDSTVHQHLHHCDMDTASIVTVLALGVANKNLGDTSDVVSDSSGVGTANSDTTNCSLSMPGTTVVCVESYITNEPGHLQLREGDIVEVIGDTESGLLEGKLPVSGGKTGLFPAHHVQEVRLRHGMPPPAMMVANMQLQQKPQTQPMQPQHQQPPHQQPHSIVSRRDHLNEKHFATAPRLKKTTFRLPAEPRTVVLHRAKKGFGFILRGAKATSPLMELMPSDKCPALQYLDDVDPGGVADIAGLRKGDFLLEINDEDVSTASHEHVVDLIRRSGDLVSMTVISMGAGSPNSYTVGLPSSKSSVALPAGLNQPPPSRLCATLPRKLPNLQANGPPLPPRRDPKTTLSVGRARAKSMVAGLETGSEQSINAEQDVPDKSNSAESLNRAEGTTTGTPTTLRTASIRARPTSSRITAAELEELFQRQHDTDMMTTSHFQSYDSTTGNTSSPSKSKGTKVYASVAEMKRAGKSGKSSTRVRFLSNLLRTNSDAATQGELHRNFHSTPNLARSPPPHQPNQRSHHSQENVAQLSGRAPFRPPPSHPPPPPPIGQLVMVDTSRASKSEYDVVRDNTTNVVPVGNNAQVESSFRPAANAKLYASPIDIKPVGFRSRSLPSHSARPHVRKSQSLRTPASGTLVRQDQHQPVTSIRNSTGNGGNQYAQPINLLRSQGNDTNKRRDEISKSSQPPVIPEPDYSLSESSAGESDNENGGPRNHVVRLRVTHQPNSQQQQTQVAETSGSSSGSGSMQHSFSVDEIQKVRTQLKSSKSYPNDFSGKQAASIGPEDEDCDNSSSGVSSDQEIPQRPHGEERLGRHAVSLAQLPPPVENANEESLVLPPPLEFEVNSQAAPVGDTVVLAPPPQFSDFTRHQHANRVRIVGAVPKNASKSKQGRLHSQ